MSSSLAEWLAWQPVTRHYLLQGELSALAAGPSLLEGIQIDQQVLQKVLSEVLMFYHSLILHREAFALIVQNLVPVFERFIREAANEDNPRDDEGYGLKELRLDIQEILQAIRQSMLQSTPPADREA